MFLPTASTPFVGRHAEQAQIERLLRQESCRLLTLVGQGGIGKTRLAVETAKHASEWFPDGVFFMALAPLNSPENLLATLAEVIDFRFYEGKEHLQQLTNYLCNKKCLLIMDNFEHLLDGADLVSALLAHLPHIKILVTSRERLNLTEEWVMDIQGLTVPLHDDFNDRETYSAIALFVQSAQRANVAFVLDESDYSYVVKICRLVEGLPLGIELAASWIRALSCATIAKELAQSIDILQTTLRNVPERHRSMRAVLQQSWALLSPPEQQVFQKLSVFQGLFTAEASLAIADADWKILSALVDKSLVKRDLDGRYRLHDLLRQYGNETLQQNPATHHATLTAFVNYYAEWTQAQFIPLKSGSQVKTLRTIEQDIENVRKAWREAIQQQHIGALSKMHETLWYYHVLAYREREVIADCNQAIDLLRQLTPNPEVMRLLGLLLAERHDFAFDIDAALTTATEAYALLQKYGTPSEILFAVISLGYVGVWHDAAQEVFDAANTLQTLVENALMIAQELGDAWAIAHVQHILGLLTFGLQNYPDAFEWGIKALRYAEQSGDLALIGEIAGPFLGIVCERLGNYEQAIQFRTRSNEVLMQAGYWMQIGWNYQGMGYIAFIQQDFVTARRYYQDSLKIYMDLQGNPHRTDQIGQGLCNVAKLWGAEGRLDDAVQVLSALLHQYQRWDELRGWSQIGIDELQPQMSPHAFEQALLTGKTLNLESVAHQFLQETPPTSAPHKTATLSDLTEREIEILGLIRDGKSNRDIADDLYFAVGTVKWYLNQIYGKLQVASRTQAIAKAREMGLLS